MAGGERIVTSDENPGAPPEPALGPAAAHLAAAEAAARHGDFGAALRERYRAVTRGLEQRGLLSEERARTAQETARAATGVAPEAVELPAVADSFDEVVYGGRFGTEAEYRRLEQADRYSTAPPPRSGPAEITELTEKRRTRRKRRTRKPRRESRGVPEVLRDWRLWAAIGGVLAVLALAYILTHLSAPQAPPPPTKVPPPKLPPPDYGTGDDSIFQTLPAWLAFGGLQFLIAWAAVLAWRGRRRGTVVGEPLPVEAPAGELLAGQAGLYRKSRDHEHVAGKLRAATLRRLRPVLGLTADTPPTLVVAAVGARVGEDAATVGAALYDPVPDRDTLRLVAAQLEWIEAEVL